MRWRTPQTLLRDRVDVSPAAQVRVPRAWTAVVSALAGLLVLYVAQAQLPSNVLTLPGQDAAHAPVRHLAPQGWAFFTKSPRDAEPAPYRWNGREQRWESASLGRHADHGFNRASRSQGIETAVVLHEALPFEFTDCELRPAEECAAAAPTAAEVTNPTPDPTLCGRIAVFQLEPTPWAWRDLLEARTPAQVVVLEVAC